MRQITSWTTFKTCYVAAVKEEMGLPVKRAWNRQTSERKVKVPNALKGYIMKAIEILTEQNKSPTYNEIRKKAFELYQEDMEKQTVKKFKGIFGDDRRFVKQVAEDEGLLYGI